MVGFCCEGCSDIIPIPVNDKAERLKSDKLRNRPQIDCREGEDCAEPKRILLLVHEQAAFRGCGLQDVWQG